jgi:hypothetical protein
MPAMTKVPAMIEGRSKLSARGRHEPLNRAAGSTLVMKSIACAASVRTIRIEIRTAVAAAPRRASG